MVVCLMCLVDIVPPAKGIEIFAEEGINLQIEHIIAKYFWFKPNSESETIEYICCDCWNTVEYFHKFYERIVQAHNRLQDQIPPYVNISSEEDPLPRGISLQSDSDQIVDTLAEDLFDSEVKVEVQDLDLLPQVEIIEDALSTLSNTDKNDRIQRACRRRRHGRDKSLSPVSKFIKTENSPLIGSNNGGSDTETELPLDVLCGVGKIKTDGNSNDNNVEIVINENESDEKPIFVQNPLLGKRRGRPKKIKEESSENANLAISSSRIKRESGVKIESSYSENDDANSGIGTEDSVASSNSDSYNNTLPDAASVEKYAKIPKRVVVKPKKYRKRAKPLVSPRRMTREEIDLKKARQSEYDKVISQFFDKFVCPKCNLLVNSFGEMCQHFRVSHNCEPGYMTCCGRKFHQRKTLAEHVYVHWNPEHFKCSTCSRLFQDARALEVHEQTHTNPPEPKDKKVFQCEKCPKSFTTKAAFEYHSFSKHVPKSEFKFTCPECNKKLPTERKLKDHMKYMHDPESAIICDKCGKQVRSQSNLKKHHQIEHSDVPRPAPIPMQCEICGTWLRHLAGLKQHMKTIHEDSGGEHRCHICNKTSTNARALKRHIYHNHECERKFKCTMCEKAFKRPQDLREHTSTHTGEVLYTCPNCPMTFFSNANMYKHRQRLHREAWEADKKKPVPPNIMQQAVGATAAMKMQQAVGATSAFFAYKQNTEVHIQQTGNVQ